jgi:tetratricopeptide (TPR) repeat protein
MIMRKYVIILLLIAVTAAVYWQVRAHDFVYYDDQEYVVENRHVQGGLTMKGVRWAFTSTHASNWHPLTWLSHMADRQFFGPSPAGPHLVNVLLHILNAVLLMVLLQRMTGGLWQSAFVAALFALHPLHVESVAWVAERKDVLSTLFFMLALLSYVRYAERPGAVRYLASLFCFVLGLMAKPMLVTLPVVLLLLDFWPLRRFDPSSFFRKGAGQSPGQSLRRLVLEKVPFFLLAALSSIATLIAQRSSMAAIEHLPLTFRFGNALISYAGYLTKMIWPSDLAVFYPLTLEQEPWKIAGAALLLILISAWAVRSSAKRPYLLDGWLWYVITLVPVIGIVQVGLQSMADRYTYIPLIGVFIMGAWGLSEAVSRWPRIRIAAAASAVLLLAVLSSLTWAQAGYWKDTHMLFSRCAAVTKDNYLALGVLGNMLVAQNRPEEALELLRKASALNGKAAEIQHNIGIALSKLGRDAEAAGHIQNAVRLNPNYARAYNDLGILIARSGDPRSAAEQFREAARIEPDNPDFRYELGVSLVDAGQLDEAIAQYSVVLREKPDHAKAHINIGVAFARQGDMNEAIRHFSRAHELSPADENARRNLDLARRMLNPAEETAVH